MDYDFAVIGGGSAGYAAARTAVKLGLKTVLIEGGKEVGGLCILRGCMPSKTLIESANRFQVIQNAGEFGLSAEKTGFNVPAIIARKRRLVAEFADYRREQILTGDFDFIRGMAAFTDAHTLSIREDSATRTITARSILIATGSEINRPPIPGLDLEGVIDSDNLLELENLPESITVLGGGPIALEMAHYLQALGCRVTIIQRGPHLLGGADEDASRVLIEAFRARGMEVYTQTKLQKIERHASLFRVSFEHQRRPCQVDSACVLNAMGRRPALDALNLPSAGITFDRGQLQINSFHQTNVPHIFAAGDASGPYEVVHIAIQQGELAARNAARLLQKSNEPLEPVDYRIKLFAVFCEPQVALVGLSEKDLRDEGRNALSAQYPFNDHGKSIVMGETEGFVKLLADPDTREILGACCVGPHASELIHEIAVAMHFRATAAQLASVPHYHPTLSEIWTYPAEDLA